MDVTDFEVVFRDGRWRVELQQGFDLQADASTAAEELGRRLGRTGPVEVYERSKRTGRWWRRNTYPRKADPRRSKN